jgi:hypothetical protein
MMVLNELRGTFNSVGLRNPEFNFTSAWTENPFFIEMCGQVLSLFIFCAVTK